MVAFSRLASSLTRRLGETVTITPYGGAPRDIQAIFRRKGEEDPLGDFGAVISQTYISAASSDVADIDEGDTITVDGQDFRAQAPIPDGRAMTKIPLLRT